MDGGGECLKQNTSCLFIFCYEHPSCSAFVLDKYLERVVVCFIFSKVMLYVSRECRYFIYIYKKRVKKRDKYHASRFSYFTVTPSVRYLSSNLSRGYYTPLTNKCVADASILNALRVILQTKGGILCAR